MAPTRARSGPQAIETPTVLKPSQSPIKKARRCLTVAQKQALIDNIQLEISERARKLRAQYSLQANGLRTRLEIRVNRIPHRMRTQIMGATLDRFSNQRLSSTAILPGMAAPSPVKAKVAAKKTAAREHAAKRDSDEMLDKENEEIENPKKRVKAAPGSRAVSRAKEAGQVLSPRSNNTNDRTASAAAARPTTNMGPPPPRSQLARPVSPVKSIHTSPMKTGASGMLSNMVSKAKAATAKATAPKPAASVVRKNSTRKITPTVVAASTAPAPRKVTAIPPPAPRSTRSSLTSATSNDSNKTTIVRKTSVKETAKEKTAGVMGTLKRMASKKKLAGADSDTEKNTVMGSLKRMTSREKVVKEPAPKPAPKAGRTLRSKRA